MLRPFTKIIAQLRVIWGLIVILSCSPLPLFAEKSYGRESFEVGFERYQVVAPTENANFSGLVLNYFFDNNVYVGTNQMSLYLRGVSDYRPDFHLGILFPFTEHISAEALLGVDF